jgi:DNA (cytosine-5)-methyltransferase 1
MTKLILSLFPGIDLLGRGFEEAGYCVVRGPDLLWGGDIRNFHPPSKVFDGIIGGSPCQDFSKARRSTPTGYGLEMLTEFSRVIVEAQPSWWLLENVPTVPDVAIPSYIVQRLDLNARECGSTQNRLRHFQFGSLLGLVLVPPRALINPTLSQSSCLASEGKRSSRRNWEDFCELQGLPRNFNLPGLTLHARYQAVGNGVHLAVARTLAVSIQVAHSRTITPRVCGCNCGRILTGNQIYATPACRKRVERRRKRDQTRVTVPGTVTSDQSVTLLSP